MTDAEMRDEAESIACAEDWDSNNDKIRAIAQLARDYSRALRARVAALEKQLDEGWEALVAAHDFADRLARGQFWNASATDLRDRLAVALRTIRSPDAPTSSRGPEGK